MDNLNKENDGLKAFWAKEFTKRGVRHPHIAINVYVPHSRIKEQWIKATRAKATSSILRIPKKSEMQLLI